MDNPYQPPEAVITNVQAAPGTIVLASRWARLGAALIDGLIAMAISLVLMVLMVGSDFKALSNIDFGRQLLLAVMGIAIFLALHGYLLAKNGQTIGKLALGIRIAKLDGSKPDFIPLIVTRYGPTWLVSQIPVIGGLLNLVDILFIFRADKRCVHDLIAKTMVVKTG